MPLKKIRDRHLATHLLKGRRFNSSSLKSAYEQREEIDVPLNGKDRPCWCLRKSAKYLEISLKTLEEWCKECPWLPGRRGIMTFPGNCGTGRQDPYCLLEDLDTVREAKTRTKEVPDIPGMTPIEEAANELGIAEGSLRRLCKVKGIEIEKKPGKDSMGRAQDRGYVPTKFVEDELSLRLGLKEGEISSCGAAKILGYKSPESARLLARTGELKGEKRPFPKGEDCAPGEGWVFNQKVVQEYRKQHPLKKERSIQAKMAAREFVVRQLGDGQWHPRKIVIDEAPRRGIKKKPLRAAIEELKVELAFLKKPSIADAVQQLDADSQDLGQKYVLKDGDWHTIDNRGPQGKVNLLTLGNRGHGFWRLPASATPQARQSTQLEPKDSKESRGPRNVGGRPIDKQVQLVSHLGYVKYVIEGLSRPRTVIALQNEFRDDAPQDEDAFKKQFRRHRTKYSLPSKAEFAKLASNEKQKIISRVARIGDDIRKE